MEQKKFDNDQTIYCPYLSRHIDEGLCYDMKMILNGYIKESALPAIRIDKIQLNEHCHRCQYR